jgi:hypothetical protein
MLNALWWFAAKETTEAMALPSPGSSSLGIYVVS